MTRSLGIIIPAYKPDIRALTAYITAIREEVAPDVIRVEIDAPRDTHLTAFEALADQVNAVTEPRGKGGAIMDGFQSIETDILAFVDADGSVPASSLADIVQQIRTGSADLSIGSRRHPDSEIISHQTVIRRLLGDAFAFTARQLLPTRCRDYQCGAKAVRADAWTDISHYCHEHGFAWDVEVVSVAGALGYEITEVPVVWDDHPDSTVDPIPTAVELATALFDVRRRTSTLIPRRHRNRQSTEQSKRVQPHDDN